MSDVTIFHNQACSKSRGALEILEERGVSHDVVRYLDTPPDRATLERILDAIPDEPARVGSHRRRQVQEARHPEGRRHDARAGDRRVARASRGDAAAGRVRRRPRGNRPPVGKSARPARLSRRQARLRTSWTKPPVAVGIAEREEDAVIGAFGVQAVGLAVFAEMEAITSSSLKSTGRLYEPDVTRRSA